MYALGAADRPPTVSELGQTTGLSTKITSRVLKTMRERGWIEYEAGDEDERLKYVILTPSGASVLRQLAKDLMAYATLITGTEIGNEN
jgi:DNA-binding MarR family transcriptional regulator